MATQDNSPGLLSKVARFVRNPTKDWSDLDKTASLPDTDHGKEALKLVIERKRHDDAVRKREFRQLRKLRQASPAVKTDLSLGVTSFRTTMGDADVDTDERATTLKKIDEIEAQMSRQWWKARPGTVSVPLAGSSGNRLTPEVDQNGLTSTLASRISPTTLDAATQTDTAASFDFQPTQPGMAPLYQHRNEFQTSVRSVFASSRMMLIDGGQILADPDMEEAAIRFANADDAGAEAALQAAWQLPDAKPELAHGWAAALFGLYRSTGQHASFERLAMDYAQRFGRSAPAWSITPQLAAGNPLALSAGATTWSATAARQHWACPVEFDDVGASQLRELVWSATVTYALDWGQVQRMSASAAKSLADMLARWCDMPLSFHVEGAESLGRLLRAHTPSGDRSVPGYFWQLRFDALRLLHLQDDYELAALDFCVTFEVSPPPWREPTCRRVAGAQAPVAAWSENLGSPLRGEAQPGPVAVSVLPESAEPLALAGEVTGDVSDIVAQWQLAVGDDGFWVVSCAQLIRVDFAAAGGLLNWVAHMAEDGKRVEFCDVPRLVAAFFNLIGINEHAQVTVRIN